MKEGWDDSLKGVCEPGVSEVTPYHTSCIQAAAMTQDHIPLHKQLQGN